MSRRPLFIALGVLACGGALWLLSRPSEAGEDGRVAPARVDDRFARSAAPRDLSHPVAGAEPTDGTEPSHERVEPLAAGAQTEPRPADTPTPDPTTVSVGPAPLEPAGRPPSLPAAAEAEPAPAERWVEEYGVPDPEHERHMIDVRRQRSLDVVERLMAGLAEQQEEALREGDTERAQKLAESVRRLEWRHRVLDGRLAEPAGAEAEPSAGPGPDETPLRRR